MQISVEKPTALERRLTVAVPEERIANEVDARLENLQRSVRIAGFRQGKAPLKIVRQQFGARVRDEIVGELLQSSFSEAMSKEALRPAGRPVIDPVSSRPGQGLTYTATFEVFPELELAPVERLAITTLRCEIGEADVDAMIEKLREQNKEWVAVERPCVDGDRLNIDFAGRVDDHPFDGGSGEEFDLVLGTGMMLEGFEDGLRGRTAGERVRLELEFPQGHRNEQLAGKPVVFEVTVNRVSEPVLPEVNDAFFEKFGVKTGGLQAFRAEVRENMEKERERALKQRLGAEVMEQVTAANDFAIPAALVEGEAQRLRQQMARDLAVRGVDPAAAGGHFEQGVRERARERVKLGLIMAEIVKQGALRAEPEKVRKMIEKMASSYEDPAAVVKYYYDNPEQLQQVEALCLEEEVVNWIAARAQHSEVSISFDALMNPVQTGTKVEASS